MKKILIILFGTVGVLLCLLWLFLVIIIPLRNDYIASETAKDIISLPLPDNTELIESKSLAGKLVGNGNGMQYFGAILVKSSLSLDELRQHYSGYADNDWTYCVEIQQTSKIEVIEHGQLSFDTDIAGEGYYIIYSWGSSKGAFNDFDIRGH